MDLSSLKEAAANITLYDIKAGVRKVQNAVMNYTEMEAKVREATNNEPWGASSSMMQEIANGTYNYQHLNEIMPIIYKRFTEKAADEWRQIYKALQLLEFLIKNGSERVIDDARSHLSLLKMLRQFQYIDQNGKDQGLNVRNRAKELAELLSDVDRIRAERKKARSTKSKYTGVEGGIGSSGGSRYGGFGGMDHSLGASYGGYSGGVYGDGGGYGGQQSDFQDFGSQRSTTAGGRDRFEEYDEFTEGAIPSGRKQRDASASSISRRKTTERTSKRLESTKKKEPEVDLFSFDDSEPKSLSSTIQASSANKSDDEDDFDEFQSAMPSIQASDQSLSATKSSVSTITATQYAAPQPVSAPKAANLSELIGISSVPQASTVRLTSVGNSSFLPPAEQPQTTAYQCVQPNYFTSVQEPTNNTFNTSSPSLSPNRSHSNNISVNSTIREDAFGSLWSTASAGLKKSTTPNSGPALGQLAKEKASAGIWANVAPSKSTSNPINSQARQKQAGDCRDLLG